MHSLPSGRRLPQPNFFRFKCHRLSPLLLPLPTPALPAPASAPRLPGLLPDARLPVNAPPLVSAHALAPAPGGGGRQARRPPSACGQTHTPGTVRQADARLHDGAVRHRQGRGTFSQSANRDSVITPVRSHPRPMLSSASVTAPEITCLHPHIHPYSDH